MKTTAIDKAKKLIQRRNFSEAIKVLQRREDVYEGNFEYYCTLGTACLYLGDTGSAYSYYELARRIRMNQEDLLLGQAAIFLRRGETDRSVQYYLDILDFAPGNKIAKAALEFIRKNPDYETICRWVDSGKIEEFYPPIGVDYVHYIKIGAAAAAGILLGVFVVNMFVSRMLTSAGSGDRMDLSSIALTAEDKRNLKEKDLSSSVVHYILSDSEIKRSFDTALSQFQQFNDNGAQVEINRILGSNASTAVKQKARLLMSYITEPTFDSLKQNFTVAQVKEDPNLYLDCFVDWGGRIADEKTGDNYYTCEFLVGYEDLKKVEEVVLVKFDYAPYPKIDGTKPVRILGKITSEDGRLCLKGKSIFQSTKE